MLESLLIQCETLNRKLERLISIQQQPYKFTVWMLGILNEEKLNMSNVMPSYWQWVSNSHIGKIWLNSYHQPTCVGKFQL